MSTYGCTDEEFRKKKEEAEKELGRELTKEEEEKLKDICE